MSSKAKKNKFTPSKLIDTGITYNKKTVYSVRYQGKFDEDEVRKYAQEKANKLKKKQGKKPGIFAVVLKYKTVGWRSGGFIPTGKSVALWHHTDSDVKDPGQIIGFEIQFTNN